MRSHLQLIPFLFEKSNPLLAFGFLASQEVKDAGVGNLGLWDREHSDSRHNEYCNVWFYRASGASLDTKVYFRIWWGSVESDDVSEVYS